VSTSEYSQTPRSESSSGSVDADQVERAKREIQSLVQEISELSRSQLEPAAFYDAMLNKVVAALAAPGARAQSGKPADDARAEADARLAAARAEK